jgi:hypothetical protein
MVAKMDDYIGPEVNAASACGRYVIYCASGLYVRVRNDYDPPHLYLSHKPPTTSCQNSSAPSRLFDGMT